jgi:hypothetical protein
MVGERAQPGTLASREDNGLIDSVDHGIASVRLVLPKIMMALYKF